MQFGSYQTNADKRQVRPKLIGLEEPNKFTSLGAALRPTQAASQAAAPPGRGSVRLGRHVCRLMDAAWPEAPAALMLRVNDPGVAMVVSRFVDAGSPRKLNRSTGVEMVPAEPAGAERQVLFGFDPCKKTLITMQLQVSRRVQFHLALAKAAGLATALARGSCVCQPAHRASCPQVRSARWVDRVSVFHGRRWFVEFSFQGGWEIVSRGWSATGAGCTNSRSK